MKKLYLKSGKLNPDQSVTVDNCKEVQQLVALFRKLGITSAREAYQRVGPQDIGVDTEAHEAFERPWSETYAQALNEAGFDLD